MSRKLSMCLINPRGKPSYFTPGFGMSFYSWGSERRYYNEDAKNTITGLITVVL